MTELHLDETDRQILHYLQQDARLSNQDLAEKIALSPSPCLRRVRRLEDLGVIKRYVAIVDGAKVGKGLSAYVSIRLRKGGPGSGDVYKAFTQAVQDWPEVEECFAMSGNMDCLLRIRVSNLEAFASFAINTLMRHEEVVEMQTSFVLNTMKEYIQITI